MFSNYYVVQRPNCTATVMSCGLINEDVFKEAQTWPFDTSLAAQRFAEQINNDLLPPQVKACEHHGKMIQMRIQANKNTNAFHWVANELCSSCGAQLVPAFSKYLRHP